MCSTSVPLLIEQFELQRLKKSDPKVKLDQEKAELEQEQEVVAFARQLYPKLAPAISPILKQFALESEVQFLGVMEENRIPEELEAQELCLLKHNELEQMKDESKSDGANQIIETL